MSGPKVSVITVCFNAASTIESTIKSVLEQTYTIIEYIIIDGGSTDGTNAVIERYKGRIATWINEPDKGIYDAMNKGLNLATGDWTFFLGADDVFFDTNIIEKVAGYLKTNSDIYYGDSYFKKAKKLYHIDAKKWSLCLHNISHQSVFYPKSVYRHIGYDLNYPVFADHVYNIKLLGTGKVNFNYIPLTISIYNDDGRSAHIFDTAYFSDLPKIVRQNFGKSYALYVFLRLSLFKLKRAVLNRFKPIYEI